MTEYPDTRNGSAPTALITTQMLTVRRKASRWPMFMSPLRAMTQKRLPITVEIAAETGNTCPMPWPSAMSSSAHGIIAAVTSRIIIPSA